MDPLTAALRVAASGLGAQSERLRIVSENDLQPSRAD